MYDVVPYGDAHSDTAFPLGYLRFHEADSSVSGSTVESLVIINIRGSDLSVEERDNRRAENDDAGTKGTADIGGGSADVGAGTWRVHLTSHGWRRHVCGWCIRWRVWVKVGTWWRRSGRVRAEWPLSEVTNTRL